MEKGINGNLLKALFLEPTPLPDRAEIYNLLFNRIFPDKDGFIFFLTTVDPSEKQSICKQLIRLLCFESNFPPPYDLLENLLSFEQSEVNQSFSSKYIPQDHFIHILNSYIFGIYLFFYHPIINKKLTARFMGKRSENNTNPNLSATKDFISFWKYFCLFHDLAYPIESAFYQKQNSEKTPVPEKIVLKDGRYNKYLESFENMEIIMYKDLISKAVSRYITVFDLLSDEENKRIADAFIDKSAVFSCISGTNSGSQNDYNIGALTNEFKNYYCIDKLYSFDHIKMFSGFVKQEDIMFIMIDKYTSCPVAFKFSNNSGTFIYKIQRYYNDLSNIGVEYFLDTDEDRFSERYEIRFCINNPQSVLSQLLFHRVDTQVTTNDIRGTKSVLNKYSEKKIRKPIRKFEAISDANELENYMFSLFTSLYCYISANFDKFNIVECLITMSAVKSKVCCKVFKELYGNKLSEIIRSSIFSTIEIDKIIAESNITNCFLNLNGEQEAIDKIFDSIWGELGKLIKNDESEGNLKASISEEMQNLILDDQNTNSILLDIICMIGNSLLPPKKNDLPETKTDINGVLTLNSLSEYLKNFEETKNVDKLVTSVERFYSSLFSDNKAHPIEDFISNYRNKSFPLDHGIMGFFIYLLTQLKAHRVLKRVFTVDADENTEKKFSTLLWNVSFDRYEDKLIKNYTDVTSEVAKSIFAHNIYPEYVKEVSSECKWKISIDKEPCCYFAMLVDALQVWGRRKYSNASVDNWAIYAADSYNVEVRNKKLNISIGCETNDISGVVRKFISSLDEYLIDASSLVSIYIEGR